MQGGGDGGGGAEWWLQVPEDETKTGAPVRMPLPRALGPRLGTYLREHRPVLAGQRGRWAEPVGEALWVSADGSPMTGMALYDRIVAHTRAAFGRSVNPHLFRDCAATSMADRDPGRIHVASVLLGHRALASVERHYNRARMGQAVRRYQDVLRGLGAEPPPGGAPEGGGGQDGEGEDR